MEREGGYQPHEQPGPEPADANQHGELLARLEVAVRAIHDSPSFRRFLDVQARFHTYSFGNTLLIDAQMPHATRVAGYRTWQRLGRQVRRGERAIRIVVPQPTRVLTDDGTREEVRLRFRTGGVFDISQTDGQPLSEVPVPTLESDDGHDLYHALCLAAEAEGVDVFERASLGSDSVMGAYDRWNRQIILRDGPRLQMTKTLAHELAHHVTRKHETLDDSRATHETVAESVAYVVLAHFGFDSGTRSFPYVAGWAGTPGVLREALGSIQRVAAAIIASVERQSGIPDYDEIEEW